jgi:hypothetical protein
MLTLRETKEKIAAEPKNWKIYYFDFVDNFRRYRNPSMIEEPFELSDKKIDGLLASTVEFLCDELLMDTPEWLNDIPPCREPFFVTKSEILRKIAMFESPLRFRLRNIFVLYDFLRPI